MLFLSMKEAMTLTDTPTEIPGSEPEYFGQRADNAGARRVRRSFRYSVAACVLFTGTLWYVDGYKRLELRETQYRMALTEEPQSARAVLRNVVRRDQERNGQPNVKYLEALAAVEEADKVLPCYEQAYHLYSEDPWLAINYGCRLFLQAQYKDARERFREAGIHAPKNALPRYLEAAALAMQGAAQGTPETLEESLRQALGLVQRANTAGDPVVFPQPLWHATLPARGYWYARLRRELAQSGCAPLYRLKDLVMRGLAEKADKAPAEKEQVWVDAIADMGTNLSGSLEPGESPPTPLQCLAGLQFRLEANQVRQRWAQLRGGEVGLVLAEEGRRLEQAVERLQQFEDGNLEAMSADRALLLNPFLLTGWALLIFGGCYAIAFFLNRLCRADRRSWGLPHPREVYWVAASGLGTLFLVLLAHLPARHAHWDAAWFRGFSGVWIGILAFLALFGLVYSVRQNGAPSPALPTYRYAAVLSRMRRYFGILLGSFLCLFCVWATCHRLIEGLYPWQVTLLIDGQEKESLRLLREVYENVAMKTGGTGG